MLHKKNDTLCMEHDKEINVDKLRRKINVYCEHCGRKFCRIDSLSRHCKICKLRKKNEKSEKILKLLEKKVEELKEKEEELKEKEEELVECKNQNDRKNTIIEMIAKTNKKAMTFIVKNYQNNPELQPFNVKAIIGEDKIDPVNIIICAGRNKEKYDEYLGNMVIDQYLKDNKQEQSLFTLDVNRKNFAVRIKDNITGNLIWKKDEQGMIINDMIISSLLDALYNRCIERNIKIHNDYVNGKDCGISDGVIVGKAIVDISNIENKKKRKKMNSKILNVIAPKFKINKNEI